MTFSVQCNSSNLFWKTCTRKAIILLIKRERFHASFQWFVNGISFEHPILNSWTSSYSLCMCFLISFRQKLFLIFQNYIWNDRTIKYTCLLESSRLLILDACCAEGKAETFIIFWRYCVLKGDTLSGYHLLKIWARKFIRSMLKIILFFKTKSQSKNDLFSVIVKSWHSGPTTITLYDPSSTSKCAK